METKEGYFAIAFKGNGLSVKGDISQLTIFQLKQLLSELEIFKTNISLKIMDNLRKSGD